MKICSSCHREIEETYNVCPYCKAIQADTHTMGMTQGNGYVNGYGDTTDNGYGYDPNYGVPVTPHKSTIPIWVYIIIGFLAVAVIISGGYFFFMRNRANRIINLTAPVYSVNEGSYSESQNVLISNNNDVEDAEVYYTLDGTTPSENSQKYINGQAVLIDKTSTLKSIVIDKFGNRSEVASVNYEITPPETNQIIQVIDSGSSNSVPSSYSSNSGSNSSYSPPSSSYSSGGGSYFFPDSASRLISESELYNLSEDECALARNEIYARHGRRFKVDWIQSYFNNQSWYNPIYSPEEFDAMIDSGKSIFNSTELKNIDTIKSYEQRMGYL